MRLNVEHDFSLTSTIFEVSVAKHFLNQLLIREFYTYVALFCKWQGINTDDVFEEHFQELADIYTRLTEAFGLTGVSLGWIVRASVLTVSLFLWRSLPVTSKFLGIFVKPARQVNCLLFWCGTLLVTGTLTGVTLWAGSQVLLPI